VQKQDEVTSILVNYPALLLRKKSEMYPEGRTSHRFKQYLRKKVTIVDKNGGTSQGQEGTEVDEAEDEDNA
jgi:hypothetical protein